MTKPREYIKHLKEGIKENSTINLDFRSLYHHFENGAFMYDYQEVRDMKCMFDETFTKCREVTEEYRTGRSRFLRLKQLILRLFAPLM